MYAFVKLGIKSKTLNVIYMWNRKHMILMKNASTDDCSRDISFGAEYWPQNEG